MAVRLARIAKESRQLAKKDSLRTNRRSAPHSVKGGREPLE
ncbi:MAG TPA: hypothetical protein VNZ03_03590 [Terriglobales bacterium]|nr:hypothetical protein [Terriglobales bacterium]